MQYIHKFTLSFLVIAIFGLFNTAYTEQKLESELRLENALKRLKNSNKLLDTVRKTLEKPVEQKPKIEPVKKPTIEKVEKPKAVSKPVITEKPPVKKTEPVKKPIIKQPAVKKQVVPEPPAQEPTAQEPPAEEPTVTEPKVEAKPQKPEGTIKTKPVIKAPVVVTPKIESKKKPPVPEKTYQPIKRQHVKPITKLPDTEVKIPKAPEKIEPDETLKKAKDSLNQVNIPKPKPIKKEETEKTKDTDKEADTGKESDTGKEAEKQKETDTGKEAETDKAKKGEEDKAETEEEKGYKELTSELKAAGKMSASTFDAISEKINEYLRILKKIRETKSELTKANITSLYNACIKLKKSCLKAKPSDDYATNNEIIKRISTLTGEVLEDFKNQLTKARTKTLEKIRDTLSNGFHFDFYYYRLWYAKNLYSTASETEFNNWGKLNIAEFMANNIQTKLGLTPAKNTDSKQLKTFLTYCNTIYTKVRNNVKQPDAKDIIANFKVFVDKLLLASVKPTFVDGLNKIEAGKKVIEKYKEIQKSLGSGETPFFLPLVLREYSVLKDVPEKITALSSAVEKVIITSHKEDINDVVKLINAIYALDAKLVDQDNVESYKKLLENACTKFDTTEFKTKKSYKNLVSLRDDYKEKVKDYKLLYEQVLKTKNPEERIKFLSQIIEKAPKRFYNKKRKALEFTYHRKIKNKIVTLSKLKAAKTDPLKTSVLNLITLAQKSEEFKTSEVNTLRAAAVRLYSKELTNFKKEHKTGIMYYIAYKHIDKVKATKEKNLATYTTKKESNENELAKLKAIEDEKGSLTLWQKGRRSYYQGWLNTRNKQIAAINKWLEGYESRKAKLKEDMDAANAKAAATATALKGIHADLTVAVEKIENTKRLNKVLDVWYLDKARKLSQ